MSGLHVKDR